MKCLRKFKWLKLPRAKIPGLKGLMSCYLKLASRAAFRKGTGIYCGYENPVEPGMWADGVVGLKSILGIRSLQKALQIMDELQALGYLDYTLEAGTKKLTYRIIDWVVQCSGQECQDEANYVTPGYGFLCMPRNITDRLADNGRVFGAADAWLDLWCHTVFRDYGNAFSFLAPAVQFGKYGAVLTLETLGQRWGWEKTKVWRFLHKLENEFPLYRLPGSFGCIIFNMGYPAASEIQAPEEADVKRIMDLIRFSARNTHYEGSDNARINLFVAWKTRKVMAKLREVHEQNQSVKSSEFENESDSRVAVLPPIIRAYFSHGRNCQYSRKCIYDCPGFRLGGRKNPFYHGMGVVLMPVDEKTYFEMQLDSTIREIEKLLKKLKEVKKDYTERRREDALEKSVAAARISEGVALKTRALPAHTGHPRAGAMVQSVIAEAIPVEIGFVERGWLLLRIPMLLPRKEKSSRSYIRGFLYPALERFTMGMEKIRYRNCVLIFRHVYDRNRPEREYRDHDNIELNAVVDAIAMFFLVDDTPLECRHYYCSAAGDEERTEVYLVPRPDFPQWLAMEKDPPKIRQTGPENMRNSQEKDT